MYFVVRPFNLAHIRFGITDSLWHVCRRFPRRGPLQLKRNMEKQKELLLEARRMLEKDLELLKVSTVIRVAIT